ncbi:MAG: M20/M25/M40 family metallo-hydrolase [Candidatus Aminicenantes bacterium]|nr:M20/M25/M40 family metallo-hydrolase [Candidatus Aminicenantes bacterium]
MSKRSRLNRRASPGALILLGLCLTRLPAAASPQAVLSFQKYADIAERIRISGLESETAFQMLRELTTKAGPRLTGSAAAARAVEMTRMMMKDMGFETWLEPIMVQHWVRGVEEARLVDTDPPGTSALKITALGRSVPTPGPGLTAPVIEVRSFEELQKLGLRVKDKIVFFNKRMNPAPMDTFSAYGEAAQFRSLGASEAARAGAAAVLVRSATLRTDDFPHTGMVQYDPQIPKIPAAAVATADADRLSDRLRNGAAVNVFLRLGCRELPPVPSANVVGQIRGTERPEEIILVGGHLDSWDLGTGAHDDGAGCVQAMEAVRLIKDLGLRPKRTIRIVLFMNEEFGSSGGRDYADAARRKTERHLAAMESDRGGFLPLGFGIGGSRETFDKLKAWEPLLQPSGILWVRPGGGGGDIGPLARTGTVLMGFVPDSQKYFDVHHSALDVLDSVHPRELELGAVIMAIMAYGLAQEGI